jgi:hypothetical protein
MKSPSHATSLQEDQATTSLQKSKSWTGSSLRKSPESPLSARDSRPPQQQHHDKPRTESSLFGAVMRKFGSSFSNALPTGSPFKAIREPNHSSTSVLGLAGAVAVDVEPRASTSLLTSPSGKTIMSFINQFNSPFKFQSPKVKRRLLNSPTAAQNASSPDSAPPSKRRRLEMPEGESRSDSRSSLHDYDDANWKEVRILDNKRLEIVDWSLRTQARIEFQLNAPATGNENGPAYDFLWNIRTNKEWKEALTYWEFRSPPLHHSYSTNEVKELPNKSIGVRGRQGSFQVNGVDSSTQGSFLASATQESAAAAKMLIQSVHGPQARFSRKSLVVDDSVRACGKDVSLLVHNQRFQRMWQQSLRSLYINFTRRIEQRSRRKENGWETATVLGTYFYSVCHDHAALFRVVEQPGQLAEEKMIVPCVLVSSTSESYRQRLQNLGVSCIELLDTIEEYEKENLLAQVSASQKAKAANEKLMSPSVKADLEALRRAHAFGESGGADVYVKNNKSNQVMTETQPPHFKAIRLSGWENVSLFFEVYLNSFGNVTFADKNTPATSLSKIMPEHAGLPRPSMLPTLIADGEFGSFEHSSMRLLRVLPVGRSSREDSEQHKDERNKSIDICGVILPGALLRLFVAARNQISIDFEESLEPHETMTNAEDTKMPPRDSFQFMMLHSVQPELVPRHLEGLKGTPVLNQGRTLFSDNDWIECPAGKLLELVVWDSARKGVAACKLDSSVPDSLSKS